MDLTVNEADEAEGCRVREVNWFCVKFEIDDAFGSDIGSGHATHGRSGCETFQGKYVCSCPSDFTILVDETVRVWDTSMK